MQEEKSLREEIEYLLYKEPVKNDSTYKGREHILYNHEHMSRRQKHKAKR